MQDETGRRVELGREGGEDIAPAATTFLAT